MERLWAPWRMAYIKGEKTGECIFCAAPSGADADGFVVRRGERCFAMLNAFPYNHGHLMIAPYRHVPSIEDLDEPESLELMVLSRGGVAALRTAYAPEGFNLGVNLGEVAGAGFAAHLHLHVVPRWGADSNFMAVTGETRVIPEALPDTFATLRDAWPSR
jgi:ATP adenylyltransferase